MWDIDVSFQFLPGSTYIVAHYEFIKKHVYLTFVFVLDCVKLCHVH